MSEKQILRLGAAVMFVDAVGRQRPAIWASGLVSGQQDPEHAIEGQSPHGWSPLVTACDVAQHPSINVVIVVDDAAMRDNYGRQIERHTSVVHASSQPAHGFYWRLLTEEPKATERER